MSSPFDPPIISGVNIFVLGSNSNWGSTAVEDGVYNHLIHQWNILDPPLSQFDLTNSDSWDGMGSYHMFVRKRGRRGVRTGMEGTNRMSYVQRLDVHVVAVALPSGEVPDGLDKATSEIEKILWCYSPYWVAGIEFFDNIEVGDIDFPEDPNNPFRTNWHITVGVDAFYQIGTDFQIDVAPYDGLQYPAGRLTYLPP